MKIYRITVLKSELRKIVLVMVLCLTATACSKKIDLVDPSEHNSNIYITKPFGH